MVLEEHVTILRLLIYRDGWGDGRDKDRNLDMLPVRLWYRKTMTSKTKKSVDLSRLHVVRICKRTIFLVIRKAVESVWAGKWWNDSLSTSRCFQKRHEDENGRLESGNCQTSVVLLQIVTGVCKIWICTGCLYCSSGELHKGWKL